MKKNSFFMLYSIVTTGLVCFVFTYFIGYYKGRSNALKETFPANLKLHLILHDLRNQVEILNTNSTVKPKISLSGTELLVHSSYIFYQKYKKEFDAGKWINSPSFSNSITQAKVISQKVEKDHIENDIPLLIIPQKTK